MRDIDDAGREGFFTEWVEDYKHVLKSNLDMDFTFVPDTPITNEREFTDALFAYANQEKVNLVITKESMYPEFTIDGIAYTAERNYSYMSRIPVAVVSCHRVDREIKGNGVEQPRKNLQWFLHNWGGVLAIAALYVLFMAPEIMRNGLTWESALIFVGMMVAYGSMAYRNKLLHFNDKTK